MNNTNRNLKDIQEFAIKKDFPYSAIIEILTKCNFNCEHCYIPKHVDVMKYETIKSIINQLFELGTFKIILTGGEVALHPKFMEIVQYIRKKGMMVELMSNVSLFTEEIMTELARLCVKVSTTMFSFCTEINDSITKSRNSAEKIWDNVLRMKQLGIQVDVKVPIMKKNYRDYGTVKAKCKKNAIPITYSVAITPRTDGDKKPMEFALCKEELDYFIDLNETIKSKDFKKYKESDYLCSAVGNSLSINVNGEVYPCNSFAYFYGNIYENTIREIWYELPNRQSLKKIKKADIKTCMTCNMNQICKKCPGLSYQGGTDFEECSYWDKAIADSKMKSFSKNGK